MFFIHGFGHNFENMVCVQLVGYPRQTNSSSAMSHGISGGAAAGRRRRTACGPPLKLQDMGESGATAGHGVAVTSRMSRLPPNLVGKDIAEPEQGVTASLPATVAQGEAAGASPRDGSGNSSGDGDGLLYRALNVSLEIRHAREQSSSESDGGEESDEVEQQQDPPHPRWQCNFWDDPW